MEMAHIIVGLFRWPDGVSNPSTAVLFTSGKPDIKELRKLGFVNIDIVQYVTPETKQPDEPTLYLFKRLPQPTQLLVARLNQPEPMKNAPILDVDPYIGIPTVSGDGAKRYLTPKNGLSGSDFPKKRDSAPPSNRRGGIPNKPETLPPSSKRRNRQEK